MYGLDTLNHTHRETNVTFRVRGIMYLGFSVHVNHCHSHQASFIM